MDEAKAWRAKAEVWRLLAQVEVDRCLARSLAYLADEADRVAADLEAKTLPPLADPGGSRPRRMTAEW